MSVEKDHLQIEPLIVKSSFYKRFSIEQPSYVPAPDTFEDWYYLGTTDYGQPMYARRTTTYRTTHSKGSDRTVYEIPVTVDGIQHTDFVIDSVSQAYHLIVLNDNPDPELNTLNTVSMLVDPERFDEIVANRTTGSLGVRVSKSRVNSGSPVIYEKISRLSELDEESDPVAWYALFESDTAAGIMSRTHQPLGTPANYSNSHSYKAYSYINNPMIAWPGGMQDFQ